MKERPIIFKGEMVRAILDGRKTQTRRVITNVRQCKNFLTTEGDIVDVQTMLNRKPAQSIFLHAHCPYGNVGDRLWVKETFSYITLAENEIYSWIKYIRRRPDGCPVKMLYRSDAIAEGWELPANWSPSIFMPRWASRIDLEITGIRVERVQDITEEDARAEGCYYDDDDPPPGFSEDDRPTARKEFEFLWDSINYKRGFSWDSNRWVWVIEFVKL